MSHFFQVAYAKNSLPCSSSGGTDEDLGRLDGRVFDHSRRYRHLNEDNTGDLPSLRHEIAHLRRIRSPYCGETRRTVLVLELYIERSRLFRILLSASHTEFPLVTLTTRSRGHPFTVDICLAANLNEIHFDQQNEQPSEAPLGISQPASNFCRSSHEQQSTSS